MSTGNVDVTTEEETPADTAGTPASAGPSAGVAGLGFALVCLVVATAVSCVVEVAYLFARLPGIGSIASFPFPLSALVAAVFNTILVAEARKWSRSRLVHAFPLLVWLLTFVCLFFGPGSNVPVPASGRGLLFLACGLGVPILWRQYRGLRALTRAAEER